MQKLPTLKQPRTRFKALYNFHLTQEPAVIRYLDPNNREDFIRYKRIFTNPMVQKYMEGVKGKITNAVIKKTLNPKDNDIRFAITTTEKDKLMGWVQFVPEETQRLKRIKSSKYLNRLIVEISYAKYIDGRIKKPVKGLVASGVRLACIKLKEMEKLHAQIVKTKVRHIQINAYVSAENIPSIKVLENAGFIYKEKVHYHNQKFKKYQGETKDLLYVLNWKKLGDLTAQE
ncbi:MAG: hypothetical protein ACD_22C00095G0002 [uncultured bacterium]|nr:MAG: hypothetical protein ACD_22C00095G0002 [uncultured bacterium]